MYLTKRVNVKNYEYSKKQYQVNVLEDGKPKLGVTPEKIKGIEIDVAYWRKFNALHSWFVNNYANGVDDCRPVYVSEDTLVELVGVLRNVKEKLDNSKLVKKTIKTWNGEIDEIDVYECEEEVTELFSPQSGFFFGSTEIDGYYKEEVDRTLELLEKELKENEENNLSCDYYYQASW